jgi:hypothetical protein
LWGARIRVIRGAWMALSRFNFEMTRRWKNLGICGGGGCLDFSVGNWCCRGDGRRCCRVANKIDFPESICRPKVYVQDEHAVVDVAVNG